MIKFFGQEAAFSIGYKAVKARRRCDVRELHDVELFEVSPVLFGAHDDCRLIGVKAARPSGVEHKATTGVVAPARRRAGTPAAVAIPCSVCGRPAGAVVPGGLGRGESLICGRCVAEAAEGTTTTDDVDTSVLSADDLADAYHLTDVELTAEEEFEQALTDEVRYQLEPDGTVALATDDPARGRTWGRDQGRAWGRP